MYIKKRHKCYMSKKVLMGFVFFIFGVLVFAQDITTDHYRFATRFDMGLGRNETPLSDGRTITTTWARVWDIYNTNRQPAIDVQTFFNTLLQEQNASGRYINDEDIGIETFLLNLELNDEKRITDFMDLNGQNVALLSVTDAPIVQFTMIYKIDGIWQITFFTRFIR